MKRVKILPKIKAVLQKEINSECPFCFSQEVGTFEIHHIDENPSNSREINNLILLCPTCHVKIEKGDISFQEVVKRKEKLIQKSWKIEFVSAVVESSLCSWNVSQQNELAFFDYESDKYPFPIINFTFINHLSKTTVLKTISCKTKVLPRGLSGLGPEPYVLKPLVRYHLRLDYRNEAVLHLNNPIAIPTQQAFLFQLELSSGYESETYPIEGRYALYFTFKFSNDVIVKAPTICLNCNDDNEGLVIRVLS